MKIVIVGLGQMGNLYVKALLKAGYTLENIVGIDIDPAKVAAAQEKFPGMQIGHFDEIMYDLAILDDISMVQNVQAAIVATNTPSHHRVIIDLLKRGIKHIFCEKPLGINMAAVNEIRDAMVRAKAQIYTAFLMNFSPAILHLIDKMQGEGLVLTEGSVVWGKNRYGDKRPTPGDLEDETVHGVGILHILCAIHQHITGINVMAQLTYPKYASPEAQAKAHALDPSFPVTVNASTMALEIIKTDKGEVPCGLHSSFIGAQQTRRVTAVLSRADDPCQPVYSVEFNFDVKTDGKIVDQLVITTLDGNMVERLEFACDKILDQTLAFMGAVCGDSVDPRLTGYNEARQAVAFSEAVVESHKKGGQMVPAYVEADIVTLRTGTDGML